MKCKVEWCNNKISYPTIGVCGTHYYHLRKFGKVIRRTFRSKNEIVNNGDYSEIIILGTDNKEKARAIVDTDDVDRINDYKWGLTRGYVSTYKVRIHRLIMNAPKGMVVDHINHNILDNRKQNLRICTYGQNSRNSKNSKGITWNKINNKWIAQLMLNRKQIYLGSFVSKKNALEARRKAELKYFKEFAPTRQTTQRD